MILTFKWLLAILVYYISSEFLIFLFLPLLKQHKYMIVPFCVIVKFCYAITAYNLIIL